LSSVIWAIGDGKESVGGLKVGLKNSGSNKFVENKFEEDVASKSFIIGYDNGKGKRDTTTESLFIDGTGYSGEGRVNGVGDPEDSL
jgi:hypothetical protein